MKEHLLAFFFILIVLVVACGQKDPVGVGKTGGTGSLFITSNIPGAAITLDGSSTGAVTPDTLSQVEVGPHTVSVEKGGYESDPPSARVNVEEGKVQAVSFTLTSAGSSLQRVVLLEEFSNTGCIPCVDADSIIGEILTSYGVTKAIEIQYHVYWPYPGDPFYLAALQANNDRTSYYHVDGIGVPYVAVDGVETPTATDGGQIQQAIDNRLALDAPISLSVANDLNGGIGMVDVSMIGMSEVPSNALRLHCAIIEDDIQYDAPNGLSHFDHIMRAMLPNTAGEEVNVAVGETLRFSYSYTVDSGWNPANLGVVAFVQDDATKEVLQAISSAQ